jgi:hypothetical protein
MADIRGSWNGYWKQLFATILSWEAYAKLNISLYADQTREKPFALYQFRETENYGFIEKKDVALNWSLHTVPHEIVVAQLL